MGRQAEEGGAAGSDLSVQSSDHTLQTSAVAVWALVCVEALPSSEYGHELCSEL